MASNTYYKCTYSRDYTNTTETSFMAILCLLCPLACIKQCLSLVKIITQLPISMLVCTQQKGIQRSTLEGLVQQHDRDTEGSRHGTSFCMLSTDRTGVQSQSYGTTHRTSFTRSTWTWPQKVLVGYKQLHNADHSCYAALTAQKHCSSQNTQTILWHCPRQETIVVHSQGCEIAYSVWQCVTKCSRRNKNDVLREREREWCSHIQSHCVHALLTPHPHMPGCKRLPEHTDAVRLW
jgi:hypothetical protein